MNAAEIFICSRCKCRYRAEDFGVNRLGERWKTCATCRIYCRRSVAKSHKDAKKCEHNKKVNCTICDSPGYLWNRVAARMQQSAGPRFQTGRSIVDILGCDKMTFYNHITAQFVGGMTWERIAEIDIDHRVPIRYPGAAGGPPTQDEIVARLDYRNCQPLWRADNCAKGNRWADAPAAPAAAAIRRLTDADVDALLVGVLG